MAWYLEVGWLDGGNR